MSSSKIQHQCTKIIAWLRADSKYVLPNLPQLLHFSEIWLPKLMKTTPNWSNPVCPGLSSRFNQQTVEIHQHSPHAKVLQTLYINFSCIKINLMICILKEYRITLKTQEGHLWFMLDTLLSYKSAPSRWRVTWFFFQLHICPSHKGYSNEIKVAFKVLECREIKHQDKNWLITAIFLHAWGSQ